MRARYRPSAHATPRTRSPSKHAAEMGCRACATPGGGCQFLGTAATAQVMGKPWGYPCPTPRSRPQARPSGSMPPAVPPAPSCACINYTSGPATSSPRHRSKMPWWPTLPSADPPTCCCTCPQLPTPQVSSGRSAADWAHINREIPRLVDALPNGPRNFATVQVFLAGGLPEVMLHLRRAGLLNTR